MNHSTLLRLAGTALLVTTLAAGCASTPKEQPAPAPAQPAAPAGPSAADAERAISDADANIAAAKKSCNLWRDTAKMLDDARAAAKEGDNAKAIKLAKSASRQAADCVNQAYLEKSKFLLDEARGYQSGMSSSQQGTLRAAEEAYTNRDGKRTYDLLSGLLAELRAARMNYTVVGGDSLWKISGRPQVYANPFQWPLIYKANREQIRDADLIFPGQQFAIDKNPSAAEVSRAVEHAKTRGAWSVGGAEASDAAYLNR
ncbi:MAG TPA: LysM peptidoglycan-binding domain-containing protein [Gammaproteobacteria bacterium]